MLIRAETVERLAEAGVDDERDYREDHDLVAHASVQPTCALTA